MARKAQTMHEIIVLKAPESLTRKPALMQFVLMCFCMAMPFITEKHPIGLILWGVCFSLQIFIFAREERRRGFFQCFGQITQKMALEELQD